jgi:xanthine dehydrogenase YagR molybdenum-binding subunit
MANFSFVRNATFDRCCKRRLFRRDAETSTRDACATQMKAETFIGQPLTRVDGRLKVTGTATYTAEFQRPKLAYGALIQSTIANGRIAKIDLSTAKSAAGVIGILTRQNAPRFKPYPDNLTKNGAPGESRVPLQDDNVYWVGQHLGIVVAETLEQATHAASLVRIQYEEKPPLLGLSDANPVQPDKFIGREKLQAKRGDVNGGLAVAAHSIDVVYSTPIENHNPIETTSTTAEWEAPDRLLIHESTRGIKQLQKVVSNAFGLFPENVRIICKFVGGAFGSKGFQWSHTLLAAAAAQLVQRPVKLTFARSQMFDSAGQRAHTEQRFSLGADKTGKLVALRHATLTHCSPVSEFTEPC